MFIYLFLNTDLITFITHTHTHIDVVTYIVPAFFQPSSYLKFGVSVPPAPNPGVLHSGSSSVMPFFRGGGLHYELE